MKKTFITILISLLAGIIAGVLLVNLLLKPPMMLEDESRYDFETTLTTVEQSAKASGWSIPAIHDLQKSLAKAGKEVHQVQVFALCKPDHAVKILAGETERIYSNMMPCRIAVYTKLDGKTYISRLNIPAATKGMSGNAKSAMKGAYKDVETILSGIVVD